MTSVSVLAGLALFAAGVIFIETNGEGPGVRLRKPKTGPDAETGL